MVQVGGYLLAIGGYVDDNFTAANSVESYEPLSRKWIRKPGSTVEMRVVCQSGDEDVE